MKNILRSIATTATLLLAFTVVPAASAGTHELGELVDYPLTAPVDGDHYFADWFWAARSHGIHHAQDLMSPKMTPVVAAAAGTVRLVNWTSEEHMNPDRCCTIALRHNDGWESWYIHLNNDTPGTDDGLAWGIADGIVPGTRVKAGQLIGWVGDSGTAELTGSHLHFEL
ncbi:MAG: M23 family metallopeptidase, partial [Actinomycetota bacterium]|nr:M23 family metallopeptidase [Actinomycetota bacterium]